MFYVHLPIAIYKRLFSQIFTTTECYQPFILAIGQVKIIIQICIPLNANKVKPFSLSFAFIFYKYERSFLLCSFSNLYVGVL